MVHYCKKLMGVVVFAKVQGQVKFESPRTRSPKDRKDGNEHYRPKIFTTLQNHNKSVK